MSDSVKPILSGDTPAPRALSTGTPDAAASTDAAQQVTVRALGTFHSDGNMQGALCAPGDTFTCDRLRAAQLRANGLVEYVSGDDEKAIHGEIDARAITERVEQRKQAGVIADRNKTTPLVQQPLRTKAE